MYFFLPFFLLSLPSELVKKDLAASILTSNFLVGFFFLLCLKAQLESPMGKASPDGNRNYPFKHKN